MGGGATPDEPVLRSVLIVCGVCAGLYVMRLLVHRFRVIFCLDVAGARAENAAEDSSTNVQFDEARAQSQTQSQATAQARPAHAAVAHANAAALTTAMNEKCAPMKRCDAGRECDECCAICLDGMTGDERVRQLPCEHVMHDTCIMQWLVRANRCPVCNRAPVEVIVKEDAALAAALEEERDEEVARALVEALSYNPVREQWNRTRESVTRNWRRLVRIGSGRSRSRTSSPVLPVVQHPQPPQPTSQVDMESAVPVRLVTPEPVALAGSVAELGNSRSSDLLTTAATAATAATAELAPVDENQMDDIRIPANAPATNASMGPAQNVVQESTIPVAVVV